MNLSALPELLLSWVKAQGTALLQGEKTQTPTFQSGQQYDGKVVDTLANGRHLVKVGTQMLDMNLPTRTQAGDTVRLTYLNAGPRPTFLLNQAVVTPAQQVQISNTAQQVNALLRMAQAPVASAATATASANSVAAPLASTMLGSVQPVAARGQSTRLEAAKSLNLPTSATATSAATATTTTSTPATTAATAMAKTSTPALAATTASVTATTSAATPAAAPAKTAPATTALASAAVSTRPIAANVLMLQSFTAAVQPMTTTLTGPLTGLLGQAVDAPRAAVSASSTLSANTLVELPDQSRHMLPVRLSQTLSESGVFYESHLAKWSRGTLSLESLLREPQARLAQETPIMAKLAELGGMPEEAARLAGRQLQMLEGAPFLWQGLAWPGQTMQWLVREEGGDDGRGDASDGANDWVTELKLTLPELGAVHAQIGLTGDRLQLRLLAEASATLEKLAAALPLLVKGLDLNGLRVTDTQIEALPMDAADV